MTLRRWPFLVAFSAIALTAAPVPRHLLRVSGALTEPSPRAAREIGDQFTAAQLSAAGLPLGEAAGLYLAREFRTEHNGVTHLVYRQRFQGLDIHGMEWRVNIAPDGSVLNAGGHLFAAPAAGPASASRLPAAARAAVSAVNPILAREANVRRSGMTARGDARFFADGMGELTGGPVWYPIRGLLQPAFHFIVTDADGVSLYDTVIDAASESLLDKRPLTMFQSAPRASVFTGVSPQPPVKLGVASNEEPPYVQRVVVPLTGSPAASPKGWVAGSETAGNNAIAGANPAGAVLLPNPLTARSLNGDFQFPLQLGPGAPLSTAYTDAIITNLFYWTNRAHDLFYDIGFNEAAGNFQAQNFTPAGAGGDPMLAYAQFGAQSPSGFADLNNAFFTTRSGNDGDPVQIAMFLVSAAGVWTDGSLSSDVILHEYAHGVTARLIPTMNSGFQGAAMNEALSDFWALEFLIPEGAPPDGAYPVGEYWNRSFGIGIRSRPYSTNLEINPLTYADLGRARSAPAIHDDGGIWMVSLWEIRANLIRQFGEAEGRRRLRRIVLDGMKLAPPAPSMVDLRDAILLAERVDFNGASQSQLWEAFAKRGLGVLAFSPNSSTIQVTASFDKPSNTGVIGLQTEQPAIGEPLVITVYDGNYSGETMNVDVTASSGDVETVLLARDGSAYSGTLFTTPNGPSVKRSGALSLIAGDAITVYYNDANTGAGTKLIEKTVAATGSYNAGSDDLLPFSFPNETATGLRVAPGGGFLRAALPFDFPFYGKKYREVRVMPEGYLQFDTALTPACLDESGFASVTGIAPLAMWMRTNGTAQPNENVYISRGPNSITFRWAGETVPYLVSPPRTPTPEPVNFSATLFENGEIYFRYGSGNQNLVNSRPIAGCLATTPIVGISRGIGNSPLFNGLGYRRANFKDGFPLVWIPPFGNSTIPKLRLESPAPGATATGVLAVRGVISDDDPNLSVSGFATASILIDGVFQGNATAGQSRPDICAQDRLPGCPFVGFLRNIDLKAAGIAPGTHTLQIRAVGLKGGFQDYPETPLTFTVADGDGPLPKAAIETAKDGDVWKGILALRGYAYSTVSRVRFVDVLIDGVAYTRASYGLSRADICGGEAAGAANCPAIGWQASVNSVLVGPELTNGEHSLQLRITEDNGRTSLQPESPLKINVDNPAVVLPKGVITSPTNAERVSGTINITGHAWDPDGRILQAILVVDGVQRVLLRYGQPRPEACAALEGVAACPNIGFDGTFDTRLLSNGNHRLGVGLVDNAGNSILIPGLTSAGMNITVNNQ